MRFLLLFIISFFSHVYASQAHPDYFLIGNQALMQKQYEQAIIAYEKGLIDGNYLPLHVNLAQAYILDQQLGKAVLEYHRAFAIDPRSSFLKNELFCLFQDSSISLPCYFFKKIIFLFNIHIWYSIASVLFWLCVLWLIAYKLYSFKKYSFYAIGVVLMLSIVFSSLSIWFWKKKLNMGVVLKKDISLKIAPTQGSPSLRVLDEGQLVTIKKTKESYFLVFLNKKEKGWIDKKNVERILPY